MRIPLVKVFNPFKLDAVSYTHLDVYKRQTLCRGDLDKTAKALYCHKNTVRYRLSKMHQLLAKKSNEKEFNENLSIAIKIYMLNEFL